MKTAPVRALLLVLAVLPACGPEEVGELQQHESELTACDELTTTPVYLRVKPSSGDSLYTTDADEAANAASAYGYTEERGVPFRVSKVAGADLSPVYRLYNSTKAAHLWTIREGEKTSAETSHGYTVDEGVGFHAWTSPSTCLVPVYRFAHPSLGKHRFAVTEAERSALRTSGWAEEGVTFYAAPSNEGPSPAAQVPPPTADTKFTLVVIPDTQRELHSNRDVRFRNRTEWLARNRRALDIRFVTHTGDLVDWDTPDHIQYVRASNGFKLLDEAQIPYAIAIGNHDTAAVCPGGGACPGADTRSKLRVTTTFNQFFPAGRFRNMRGAYEAGKVDNAFHTFQAGGLNWIVINLELWPRVGAIKWAKSVLNRFPRHNAIFITHSHLTSTSGIERSNGGYGASSPQYVFDNLYKQHANVRLIFSGHTGTSGHRVSAGVHGNTFHQFLNCYHDKSTNPTRLVEIDTAANTLSTRVFNPLTNNYRADGSHRLRDLNWVR